MPRSYPAEFRRKVLDLVEAGKPVAEIADQLGVTGQTIYNWRNQDLIDRGLRPGVTTAESVEGWDSLAHIQIVVGLERAFGIRFNAAELIDYQNVGALADGIQRKLAGTDS